jgi:prepilin-type processing-associated H-X9-DG protein
VAGSFAAALHDDGLLHDLSTLDCPSNGPAPREKRLPRSEMLRQIRSQSPDDYCRMLRWDYAYNVGYRHPSGRPGPVPASLSSRLPLLADEPPHRDGLVLEGNSPNHALRGQNVLFTDGHVGWFNTRQIDPLDPDLFLNNAHEPAPGLHPEDAALIPSVFSFPSR